jgi:hypothetical protein
LPPVFDDLLFGGEIILNQDAFGVVQGGVKDDEFGRIFIGRFIEIAGLNPDGEAVAIPAEVTGGGKGCIGSAVIF